MMMMSCRYQYCMPGGMNNVSFDRTHPNDNNNTTSFSSLHGYGVCTVPNWVRHDGTTIYISTFCKRNASLLSLLSSAYHPRLGWLLRNIFPLQFDSLFVFDSVDRHVNNSSSSLSIIRVHPRSSAFFPFRSHPPPRPP